MVIIAETLRTLFADQQYTAVPLSVDFVLDPIPMPIDALAGCPPTSCTGGCASVI